MEPYDLDLHSFEKRVQNFKMVMHTVHLLGGLRYVSKIMNTVNVLKFQTLVTCQKGLDK